MLGWLLLLVVLGLNLRPILTSVSPLIGEIRTATGMGYPTASLLTMLPVFCMGLVALFAIRLERWVGEARGMSLGLLCIALACLSRLFAEQAWGLVGSALLAGLGVGVIQVLVPGLVKRQCPHWVPLAMGVYAASMMGGGGVAALFSPWLAESVGQWRVGLGIWLLPALVALPLWLLALRYRQPTSSAFIQRSFFGNRRAWLLAFYFGLINWGYPCMVAWLPTFYMDLGGDALQGGRLLAAMTLFQVIATLLLPSLAQRVIDRRGLLMISLLAELVGFAGLALMPQAYPLLWVGLAGFGLGACFALALILALDHSADPREAGQLAAFVQGIGFIITGISPWLAGWLRDLSGDFQLAWIALGATTLIMIPLTQRFSPESYARIDPYP